MYRRYTVYGIRIHVTFMCLPFYFLHFTYIIHTCSTYIHVCTRVHVLYSRLGNRYFHYLAGYLAVLLPRLPCYMYRGILYYTFNVSVSVVHTMLCRTLSCSIVSLCAVCAATRFVAPPRALYATSWAEVFNKTLEVHGKLPEWIPHRKLGASGPCCFRNRWPQRKCVA